MKSMPEKPSSILPDRPADVGRGEVTTPIGTAPGLGKIRAPKDWKGGSK